jgi:hypothetical protein
MEEVCAEGAGCLLEFGVEGGEGGSDDADDDGGVVESVGEEDKNEGGRMKDEFGGKRKACPEPSRREERQKRIGGLENCGDQSVLMEERVEGGGDYDGGQEEGYGCEGVEDGFAEEVIARKQDRRWQTDDESEER